MYKETKQVLNLLSRNKLLRIGIFSTGYDRFQRKKIKEIEDFLHKEHIYIFVFKDRELSNIIKRYKTHSLYLIDDHLGILYMAKRVKKKVFTIWVKRGRFAENQKNIPKFEPDAVIENLSEVVKIVSHDAETESDSVKHMGLSYSGSTRHSHCRDASSILARSTICKGGRASC